MKIISTKENLLQGLEVVQTSSGRTTLPILYNFLLEVEDKKVKLVKTDLEMAVTHFIEVEIVEKGSITIPLKEFHDIINSLPADKDIIIYTEDSKVFIECAKSKFSVIGTPKEEYPIIPQLEENNLINLSSKTFQKMVQKTIFSASTQETRYVLNGLLFNNTENAFEVIATDGRRLALCASGDMEEKKPFKIIVPAKVLYEVLRFINSSKLDEKDAVIMSIGANQIGFKIKNTIFISRIIEGNFPSYEQVIPTKKEVIFTVNNKEMTAITKRAALCTADKNGAVRYELSGDRLIVKCSSSKMEFSDEIAVDYKGGDFEIAFYPQHILDMLKAAEGDKVVFSMTTSLNPALIESEADTNTKYVIMPVRI